MPDKLTALRIKQQDGTYSAQIPVGALAENVAYNNDYDLKTVLGNVNMTKGNLQFQIDTKIDSEYVEGQISEDVSNWLDENVNPVGSAVVVDSSLSIDGAAADAKVTGDKITDLKSATTDITGNTQIQMVANKYIDLSGTSVTMSDGAPAYSGNSNLFSVGYMACAGGDVFIVNGVGGGQTRIWGFIDSDGLIKAVENANRSITDKIVVAPEGSAFIIVHTRDGRFSYKNNLVKNRVSSLESANPSNLLDTVQRNNNSLYGITYIWTGNACEASGTLSASSSYCNILSASSVSEINASPFELGKTYYVKYSGEKVGFAVYATIDGTSKNILYSYNDAEFAVPENATALTIRLVVADSGSEVSEIVNPKVYNSLPNYALQSDLAKKNEYIYYPDRLSVGAISISGMNTNDPARARTDFPVMLDNLLSIESFNGVEFTLRFYQGGTYLGRSPIDWITSYKVATEHPYKTADNIKLVFRKSDNENITDLDDITSSVQIRFGKPLRNIPLHLELGTYSIGGPAYDAATNRCRHTNLIYASEKAVVWFDSSTYAVSFRALNEKNEYISSISQSWITTSPLIIPDYVRYFYLVIKKTSGADITTDELFTISQAVSVQISGDTEKHQYILHTSSPVLKQGISDNIMISPTMCAVKYKNESGKQPVPIGWLFRDNDEPYNFYYSTDGKNITQLFTWDKSVTDNGQRTPYEYSIGITYEGDIICVYRGELAYYQGASTLRQNPIVYPHGNYTNPVQVSFTGTNPKPTSWLQNTGCYAESGAFYCAEYTRFRHDYAYVWKVSSPYTNASNWTIIKTFEVSGVGTGFKHCHNIDRDPYTGVLWLSTGDVPPASADIVGTPGIYYSTDNGSSWTTLIEDSELYCRQLNFIWTPDYVYWASDTRKYDLHYLIRARRNSNGIIDMSTSKLIYHFYTFATYNICYSDSPRGIICLERSDGLTTQPVNVYFWSIDDERMYIVHRYNSIGNGHTGFRVEAMNHYPASDGGYYCGFSLAVNNMDIPGNQYNNHLLTDGYVESDVYNVGCLNNIRLSIAEK